LESIALGHHFQIKIKDFMEKAFGVAGKFFGTQTLHKTIQKEKIEY